MTLYLLAIIGQSLDIITTAMGFNAGFVEANPLLGPGPNLWLGLLLKLALVTGIFLLVRGWGRPFLLGFAAVVGIGAAGWNLYVLHPAI